jgi:hypothetical protein
MGQWETIVSNFQSVLGANIPALQVQNPLEQTEDLVDLAALPETVVGERYALQCSGITDLSTEINTVYFTTYRVRLQLSFWAADRLGYDQAVANFEAVIRARLNVATWNTIFDSLELLNSTFATAKGVVLGDIDFAVKVRGS